MDWSDGLGSLRRGLGIATRAAVARVREHTPAAPPVARRLPGRFVALQDFGANPGRLRLRLYLPPAPVPAGAPLIVLLHGCGQDAASFAADTGWTALADRLSLPLLLPEQQEENNRQRCFQWFHMEEIERGHGEAASIAAMVSAAIARFKCDPKRVFIAGLSAGGAMAAAMLAAYPDLFAAGAVFAGLPVGSATSAVQALARMAHGGPNDTPAELADRARDLAPSDCAGPWPRLSVWHGDADQIVAPDNGRKLVTQWCALHGLPPTPTHATAQHCVWGHAVEFWSLPGLGHAWAIGPTHGQPSQFALRGPVDAVHEIARFWGLEHSRRG